MFTILSVEELAIHISIEYIMNVIPKAAALVSYFLLFFFF